MQQLWRDLVSIILRGTEVNWEVPGSCIEQLLDDLAVHCCVLQISAGLLEVKSEDLVDEVEGVNQVPRIFLSVNCL